MAIPLSRRRLIAGMATIPALLSGRTMLASMKESRAIFCEGPWWIRDEDAKIVCDRVARAGFNVLIACVWHGTGTSWPSELAPWDTNRHVAEKRIPGEDPLANLFEIAHGIGLEVHPCFTVMLRRRNDIHPEFAPVGGYPTEMYDAHNPAFQDFIVALTMEIVERYPVDGVHLDYIRTGTGFYKNSGWMRRYEEETGRDMVHDWRTLVRGWKEGQSPPEAHALIAWQEKAVGAIVRRVSAGLRKETNKAVLSVYAKPFETPTLAQGRDAAKWADEGTVDVIYRGNHNAQPDWEEVRREQMQLQRPEAYVVMCGNYDRIKPTGKVTPREGKKVSELLTHARTISRGNGVGLYLYNQLSDDQIEALRRHVFQEPAVPSWHRGYA